MKSRRHTSFPGSAAVHYPGLHPTDFVADEASIYLLAEQRVCYIPDPADKGSNARAHVYQPLFSDHAQ
jgi:hypothetical protein